MSTVKQTPKGWPLLEDASYIADIPEYTARLADKLDKGDANVAAAINAAQTVESAINEIEETRRKLEQFKEIYGTAVTVDKFNSRSGTNVKLVPVEQAGLDWTTEAGGGFKITTAGLYIVTGQVYITGQVNVDSWAEINRRRAGQVKVVSRFGTRKATAEDYVEGLPAAIEYLAVGDSIHIVQSGSPATYGLPDRDPGLYTRLSLAKLN